MLLPENEDVITVDPAAFEQMVASAMDSLPHQFAALIENVAVLVEPGPGPPGLLGCLPRDAGTGGGSRRRHAA